MKAVAVSIWIFINLVLIGMCSYIYLLWSQYWLYVERQQNQVPLVTNNNNGYITNNQVIYLHHSEIESIEALVKNRTLGPLPRHHSRPSATSTRKTSTSHDPKQRKEDSTATIYKCNKDTGCAIHVEEPVVGDKKSARIAAHKNQLLVQLRRVLIEESSVFKARGDGSNPYDVQYSGRRTPYLGRSVRELVCELKRRAAAAVKAVSRDDEPFRSLGLGELMPAGEMFGGRAYNTCGIVTNAGSLHGAKLGEFIDSHDVVMRFNHAPTAGHEADVGTKTTIRIVNSQVVTKPKFDFLNSPLYRNVSLLAWDPSNYTSTLADWYRRPDFDLFAPYFAHRRSHPTADFRLLDPRSLWTLWDYIQSHIPNRIRRNPPSSGFLGLALLLPHCSSVDLFEYVPSVRLTKRCHYWDVVEDSACTFGVWHPLSAEKILTLSLNIAPDAALYLDGFARVPGYRTLGC